MIDLLTHILHTSRSSGKWGSGRAGEAGLVLRFLHVRFLPFFHPSIYPSYPLFALDFLSSLRPGNCEVLLGKNLKTRRQGYNMIGQIEESPIQKGPSYYEGDEGDFKHKGVMNDPF